MKAFNNNTYRLNSNIIGLYFNIDCPTISVKLKLDN